MESFVLQDWVTIRGAVGVASVTQGADAWLDITDHEDLVLYVEVKGVTNAPVMNYQTSPTRQEATFLPLVTPFTMTSGLRTDAALFAYALTPPARQVRWKLSSSNTGLIFDATFRIFVAAYSLG